MRKQFLRSAKVIALRTVPEFPKLPIVNEDIWCVGCIGPINEVIETAIQKQGTAVCVKEHGRERIVVPVNNQCALRGAFQRLREWPRGQIGVESDHGQAGGMEKNNHHHGSRKKSALPAPDEGSDAANTK